MTPDGATALAHSLSRCTVIESLKYVGLSRTRFLKFNDGNPTLFRSPSLMVGCGWSCLRLRRCYVADFRTTANLERDSRALPRHCARARCSKLSGAFSNSSLRAPKSVSRLRADLVPPRAFHGVGFRMSNMAIDDDQAAALASALRHCTALDALQ